jgi:hypothetical protein
MVGLNRYTDFVPHMDNTGEIISAEDVNEIQDVLEVTQKEIFIQQNKDFLQKHLGNLENHPEINALWIELLNSDSCINMADSQDIVYSADELAVLLAPDKSFGTVVSAAYASPNGCLFTNIVLYVNSTVSNGGSINYEISNNGLDYFVIIPNTGEMFTFPTEGNTLILRAKITDSIQSSKISSWAVLYTDSTIIPNL